MPRISYVNGQFLPHHEASVHIEDRGYQFADGVYEVIGLINNNFADERGHLDRLERSCHELSLAMPIRRNSLKILLRELVRKNRLKNAAIYIQITRGVSKRDFKFPDPTKVASSLTLICWPFQFQNNPIIETGIAVASFPDQRWARRDIKTIALLPQTMAKQAAVTFGAQEAWLVDENGFVTEGASSNAWILSDGRLVTRQANTQILRGVTRTAVEEIAKEEGIAIDERPFTIAEALKAEEAFCTSATSLIMPVVQLNDEQIADGIPGALTKKIYQRYRQYVEKGTKAQISWNKPDEYQHKKLF